jgi:NAD(P)-dependent dehydrogenase (short-subunit alcohol dehydrogenase family)
MRFDSMNAGKGFLLVTGAGSGLGEACVAHFLEAGWCVLGIDLRIERPVDDRFFPKSADVCDEAAISMALQEAIGQFGELRGVIHCAGVLGAAKTVGRKGPHDLAAFERIIRINLIGAFNVGRLAAQAMSQNKLDNAGGRGVIVLTSSVAAEDGQMGQAAYAASKGGVASMTLPMARDLAGLGIRVVSIAPGVFETPMMQAAPEGVRNSLLAITQFPKRFGRSQEFAALAQSVLENSMLNGCVIRLDGAMRMPPS